MGPTIKATAWKERTGFYSDIDYIRHLEAAFLMACERIAEEGQMDEKECFEYFLYELDNSKYIEN